MTFSIITVVYNGADLLPGTVDSVRNQRYPDIEYIIVDGASKDDTTALIARYAESMPHLRWISEPDKGLYDAMNKGLDLATGDFVWFLNAGDHLHAPDTVEKIAAMVSPKTDVLYGETLLVNDARQAAGTMSELSTRKLPTKLHWKDYKGGMLVVHQSFIARRSLAPHYEQHNLVADYNWCIEILKKSRENVNTGLILSDYLMGGMSKKRHQQSLKDRFGVMVRQFGWAQAIWAHLLIVVRAILHRIVRNGKPVY
ncbi:MAG: glycosyltransferase [Lewinellaceae bacterium]|nr:glycosyltransferase [Lewinellaceae bacterium]